SCDQFSYLCRAMHISSINISTQGTRVYTNAQNTGCEPMCAFLLGTKYIPRDPAWQNFLRESIWPVPLSTASGSFGGSRGGHAATRTSSSLGNRSRENKDVPGKY